MSGLKNHAKEKEIDLLELAKKLWVNKRFIIKVTVIGLIIGIIIAYSIPKTYTSTVTLAPESQSNSGGNVGALAAMAGINIGGTEQNVLASPEIFPTLLSSTPFLTGLFDVKVRDTDRNIDTTLYSYLKNDQKTVWWASVLGFPAKLIGSFSRKKETIINYDSKKNRSSVIVLSREEEAILNQLKNMLKITVDKKSGIITLSSTMQSPQICAYIADTVTSYLQNYVINYRTLKSRQDLEFSEKLYDEAKADYYKKQQDLAAYSDANMAVISAKYATTRDRLQNELSLAYSVYNQMSQQLQMAKVKVQDTTPVYTVIQPAVEPLLPSAPKKTTMILMFAVLFGFFACGWILGRSMYQEYLT